MHFSEEKKIILIPDSILRMRIYLNSSECHIYYSTKQINVFEIQTDLLAILKSAPMGKNGNLNLDELEVTGNLQYHLTLMEK